MYIFFIKVYLYIYIYIYMRACVWTPILKHAGMYVATQCKHIHVCTLKCMCNCEGCNHLSLQMQIMNTCNNYVYMHACLQIWMFVRLYLCPCNYVRTSLCTYVRQCKCMDGWMYGYACMHLCKYVCMYACLHVCRCAGVHVYVDVWMYVSYLHVCMYAGVHVYVDVWMYVCMYARVHVCMHMWMYVCM